MGNIMLADEMEEMMKDMTDDGLLGGVFLARPTGEVLDDDNTFIEVYISNKSFFAKPCFSFGSWNAPSKEWLTKYKDEIMVWIAYENGNPAHPVYLGVQPLNNKVPAMPYKNGKNWKSTKFRYWFDDETEEFYLEKIGSKFSVKINSEILEILNAGGSKLTLVDKTGQFELKNKSGIGIKSTGTSVILGKGEGTQSVIKGENHIANIQTILNTLVSTPMIVNPTTGMATLPPPVIAQLSTAIGKLGLDLSKITKIE